MPGQRAIEECAGIYSAGYVARQLAIDERAVIGAAGPVGSGVPHQRAAVERGPGSSTTQLRRSAARDQAIGDVSVRRGAPNSAAISIEGIPIRQSEPGQAHA